MKLNTKLTTARSKSIAVSGVLIAASLAFTAATASAATTHRTAVTHHVVHTRHVASAKRGPIVWQQPPLVPFFAGLFGLPFPAATYAPPAHNARGRAASDSGYDPTFDTPAPDTSAADANSWAIEQNAQQASEQAIQEENQSLQQLDDSIAAAEAQNDAANAASQQYLINNGM